MHRFQVFCHSNLEVVSPSLDFWWQECQRPKVRTVSKVCTVTWEDDWQISKVFYHFCSLGTGVWKEEIPRHPRFAWSILHKHIHILSIPLKEPTEQVDTSQVLPLPGTIYYALNFPQWWVLCRSHKTRQNHRMQLRGILNRKWLLLQLLVLSSGRWQSTSWPSDWPSKDRSSLLLRIHKDILEYTLDVTWILASNGWLTCSADGDEEHVERKARKMGHAVKKV